MHARKLTATAKTPQSSLSRRERQIMDIIYRLGRATAAEVLPELPGEPTYSTVRAQLRVLAGAVVLDLPGLQVGDDFDEGLRAFDRRAADLLTLIHARRMERESGASHKHTLCIMYA